MMSDILYTVQDRYVRGASCYQNDTHRLSMYAFALKESVKLQQASML